MQTPSGIATVTKDRASDKDRYFVAAKAFLVRDGQIFIFKDRFGDWDLPGGRLRRDEFQTPLEDVLRRKLHEELGTEVRCQIGGPAIIMRHERREAAPGLPIARIFALGYPTAFLSGEIRLSPQHLEYRWAALATLRPEDFFTGGWLAGVQDYLRLQRL